MNSLNQSVMSLLEFPFEKKIGCCFCDMTFCYLWVQPQCGVGMLMDERECFLWRHLSGRTKMTVCPGDHGVSLCIGGFKFKCLLKRGDRFSHISRRQFVPEMKSLEIMRVSV